MKYGYQEERDAEVKRRVLYLISQIKHKLYHEFIPEPKSQERHCPALGEIIREELDRDPSVP